MFDEEKTFYNELKIQNMLENLNHCEKKLSN
jgi:hypothetical protein